VKYIPIIIVALSVAACGTTPGTRSPQEKLDHGEIACRRGQQFLYIRNSGYSSSWVQLIGDNGKPQRC